MILKMRGLTMIIKNKMTKFPQMMMMMILMTIKINTVSPLGTQTFS